MVDKKVGKKENEYEIKDVTTCEATRQMLIKARLDSVETHFDRAVNMKACPIGADSACCKNCFMGPCRMNTKDQSFFIRDFKKIYEVCDRNRESLRIECHDEKKQISYRSIN